MCNRARMAGEIETIWGSVAELFSEKPRDNRINPRELRPKGRAYIIREEGGIRAWDVMTWDVLGGQAPYPMTNIRNLALPQWRRLAESPANRCIIPFTEFCEFTPDKYDLGDGKPPLKGEMWFSVIDQPVFAVAGFCQPKAQGAEFSMVTCEPNAIVAPIHPKAMISILAPGDIDTWLRGSYDEIVELQRSCDANSMAVRGPVFPTREVIGPSGAIGGI